MSAIEELEACEIVIVLAALVLALIGISIQLAKLHQVAKSAPRLQILGKCLALEPLSSDQDAQARGAKVAVIIPAYNEADNIEGCVTSVLESTEAATESITVWVVDDQSSDRTLEIAQTLQTTLNDPRFNILVGQPRPQDEGWIGKNWACFQGAQQARGEFLLFLDADVRLKPGAIATAIYTMQTEAIDLLTLCPQVVCGCLGEWLVQPLILALLAVGFDFSEVSDPTSEVAFANGQFMLFRRSAYETLGGHRAVARQVVEDVELARRVKQKGLALKYAIGHDLASVRMYPSWAAVWEGWTKNWYLGSRRNLPVTLYTAGIVVWLCALPWLVLVFLLGQAIFMGLNWLGWLAVGVAFATIVLQYELRQTIKEITAIPPRYWWLTSLGGILVAAIALGSIIKTETGWGWTWRGRSLKGK